MRTFLVFLIFLAAMFCLAPIRFSFEVSGVRVTPGLIVTGAYAVDSGG